MWLRAEDLDRPGSDRIRTFIVELSRWLWWYILSNLWPHVRQQVWEFSVLRLFVRRSHYVDIGLGTLSLDLIMLTLDWEHCHWTLLCWHWTRNIVTGPNYVDTGPGTLSLDLIMLTLDWEHCHRTKNTITGPHYVEVGLETLSLVSMLTHVCQWTSNTISPQISQQKSLHFKWFANQFILNHSQPWKVDMLRHKKSVVKLLPLA